MRIVKSFALFCDDVRQEASGQTTLIGVYGPQIFVGRFPHRIRQLCIVVDVRLAGDAADETLLLKFSFPNDKDDVESEIDLRDILAEEEPFLKRHGFVGAAGNHVFRGVAIQHPGKIIISAKLGMDAGFEEIGFLEIVRDEDASG